MVGVDATDEEKKGRVFDTEKEAQEAISAKADEINNKYNTSEWVDVVIQKSPEGNEISVSVKNLSYVNVSTSFIPFTNSHRQVVFSAHYVEMDYVGDLVHVDPPEPVEEDDKDSGEEDVGEEEDKDSGEEEDTEGNTEGNTEEENKPEDEEEKKPDETVVEMPPEDKPVVHQAVVTEVKQEYTIQTATIVSADESGLTDYDDQIVIPEKIKEFLSLEETTSTKQKIAKQLYDYARENKLFIDWDKNITLVTNKELADLLEVPEDTKLTLQDFHKKLNELY